jgi:DNA-binding NtrC family response regulator
MTQEKTLLIVEDDESQRVLYERAFTKEGYKVVLAVDGTEAIEKARTEKPDLIVMDIRMPRRDGIDAMQKILGENKRVPVVINTAYPTHQQNFMTWAADAYVIKSADLTKLKETVKEVLASRREAAPAGGEAAQK